MNKFNTRDADQVDTKKRRTVKQVRTYAVPSTCVQGGWADGRNLKIKKAYEAILSGDFEQAITGSRQQLNRIQIMRLPTIDAPFLRTQREMAEGASLCGASCAA